MCFNASIQAYNYDTVLDLIVCRKAGALNNTRMLIFQNILDVLPYKYRKAQFDITKDYEVTNDQDLKEPSIYVKICRNKTSEVIKKFKQYTIAQDEYRDMSIKDFPHN